MAVEIVQFEIPGRGRRIGFVEGEIVRDITAHRPELVYLYYAFQAAVRMNRPLAEYLRSLVPANSTAMLSWRALLDGTPRAPRRAIRRERSRRQPPQQRGLRPIRRGCSTSA
jgi:hypothetical protein